ncbi:Transcription factor hamlet like [Thalictrum thalictroides]|uniref:Transcription factor hamlet like n=1 Tax=Thalictrum thalictroides TaxID=46969 RepID=A0A7J6V8X6_THATH|nr:Transcription factor hamlet like [Thalictrum thalictroides]
MNKSPIFPANSEPAVDNAHGFDPTVHFSQFLQEARMNYTTVAKTQSFPQLGNKAQTKMPSDDIKSNKSWKTALFSWFKVDKKQKPPRAWPSSHTNSYLKHGSLSAPIYGSSGRKATPFVTHRVSGPISNLLTLGASQQLNIPYVTLDELNHPTASQAYGPVYLVT